MKCGSDTLSTKAVIIDYKYGYGQLHLKIEANKSLLSKASYFCR